MSQPLRRFPDVQRALVTLLEPLAGGAGHAGSETPEDLQGALPFIRVTRRGGSSNRLHDYASVEVDVFAATYGGDSGAEALAEAARELLTSQPHTVGRMVLDRITCMRAPAELPWAPGVRRINATYQIVSRRYATS